MLCAVSKDTGRVISARRMATLRDLGSDPSVARTEPETPGLAGRQLDLLRAGQVLSIRIRRARRTEPETSAGGS
jgi:hypothetical protein